jgi:hypothetical protein
MAAVPPGCPSFVGLFLPSTACATGPTLGLAPSTYRGVGTLSVGAAAFDSQKDFFAATTAARAELPADTFDFALRGDDFDHEDDDEVRAHYPRLAATYD